MVRSSLSLFILVLMVVHQSLSVSIPKRHQVLMISFDGMQSGKFEQFLKDNPNSTFNELIKNGVKAEYMIPSFPTLTFPNHFTLVTGLNIESHGIVGNTIYDPIEDKRINFLSDPTSIANNEKWWNKGEPIWLTARNQGLKTGAFFWTGSEVITRTPDVWMKYNGDYPEKVKIDDVINWISKFKMDLTLLYFDEPDHEGHEFNPDSPEYMKKIKDVDEHLRYLVDKLKILKLYDDLNIVIVSDHGMATMTNSILIQDYVNLTLINSTRTVYGVTANIHPVQGFDQEVYDGLKKIPNARVFYKNEIPNELFYSKSERIAPILVACDEGYAIANFSQTLKGNHGFDNKFVSMRTIFVASGPNFKKNVVLKPFKNVDVYPLICELTQVECKPHNGSISTFSDALQFSSDITTTTPSNSSSALKSFMISILGLFLAMFFTQKIFH